MEIFDAKEFRRVLCLPASNNTNRIVGIIPPLCEFRHLEELIIKFQLMLDHPSALDDVYLLPSHHPVLPYAHLILVQCVSWL